MKFVTLFDSVISSLEAILPCYGLNFCVFLKQTLKCDSGEDSERKEKSCRECLNILTDYISGVVVNRILVKIWI